MLLLRSFCFVITVQALVKRFSPLMNAITKFFAGLSITVAGTSIGAFKLGITGPNVIQKMVYNDYGRDHRKNNPEKHERKFLAQRFFHCGVTGFFHLFEGQNVFYSVIVPT